MVINKAYLELYLTFNLEHNIRHDIGETYLVSQDLRADPEDLLGLCHPWTFCSQAGIGIWDAEDEHKQSYLHKTAILRWSSVPFLVLILLVYWNMQTFIFLYDLASCLTSHVFFADKVFP